MLPVCHSAGIRCFRNPSTSSVLRNLLSDARVRLKERPEDFVVQEITPEGTVCGDSKRAVAQSPTTCSSNRAPKRQRREEIADDRAPDEILATALGACEKGCSATALSELSNATHSTMLVLVCSDKEARKMLHRSIATLHPQLVTTSGDAGCNQVVVRRNGAFDAICDKISPKDMRDLQKWARAGPDGRNLVHSARSDYKGSILLSSTAELDKIGRREVHHGLASAMGSKKIGTRTDPSGGIIVYWKFTRDGDKRRGKKRWRSITKMVKFEIRKHGVEQQDALERLARCLCVPSHAIGIAGTKDKRAVTYQMASAPFYCDSESEDAVMLSREAIEGGLRDQSDIRGEIECTRFTEVESPISLGQLQGNRFTIVARYTSNGDEGIADAVSNAERSLGRLGFINYYGLQRLGYSSGQFRSHDIGRMLLCNEWDSAVCGILHPRGNEGDDILAAKQIFLDAANKRDGAQTLRAAQKMMPRRMGIERSLLGALNRFGYIDSNDRNKAALAALKTLPPRSVSMWAKTYQSYVWNCFASAVIEKRAEAVDDQIPAPGWHTNEYIRSDALMREVAEGVLGKDGLDIFDRSKTSPLKPCRLKGTFRRLIIVPKDVSAKCTIHPSIEDGTPENTITLVFSLPAGSYATCAIREMLGIEKGIMAPILRE